MEHSMLLRMSFYIFFVSCFCHLRCLCNSFNCLSYLVCCWSSVFVIQSLHFFFLNNCPYDYTSFVMSGKVGIPETGLTKLVGCLSLLAVLNRSAIFVYSKFLLLFYVLSLCVLVFNVFHRTELVIFLFLLVLNITSKLLPKIHNSSFSSAQRDAS